MTNVELSLVERLNRGIALKVLRWTDNPHLVEAADKLIADGLNNAAGHLSAYMAGRFIDAYEAARTATEEAAASIEALEKALRDISELPDRDRIPRIQVERAVRIASSALLALSTLSPARMREENQ